jgi:DNA topoisomerase-1
MKSLLKSLVNKRLPFNLVNTDKKILPPDPLKTSTLLQECAKLGISNKDTMAIAQKLYEGVDIDGQKVGVITYHRTDSVRISDYGVNLAKEILGKVNVFNRKNVSKFDAHEAIRITKSFPLDYLKKFLSSKEMKVYELIYNRFLASFCDPLKYVYQVLTCNLVDELSIIYESGKIKDGGFTKFLPNFIDNFSIFKNEFLDPKDSFLTILDFSIEEDYTKPPSRYTLSSIIKKMEQSGIGRPSTYSQTIEILKKRNYISLKKGSIFITDIGRKVIEFLFGKFSKYSSLLSVEFTSILEEVLDKIESSDFNEAKKIALENILRIYNELSSNDG